MRRSRGVSGGQEEDGTLHFLCSYLYVLSVHAKVGNTDTSARLVAFRHYTDESDAVMSSFARLMNCFGLYSPV